MDEDAMDYEMQRHDPHQHVGPRVGGGCPALAGWRHGDQYRNMWQEHRGWSQQYFPPMSSDAFLHPHHHPHPPSFLQHWPHSNTTATPPRPADSSYEGSFNHQIPEFSALPPISAHQPYSPVTFVPPAPRPLQRNPQVPQGPGDFQHILHSHTSPNSTAERIEVDAQGSDSQSASRGALPPASAPPSEPNNASSGQDTDANRPSHPSHNPQLRTNGHGFPPGHPDVNMQPHARLPPPASNPRAQPIDSASRRATVAAYGSREGFTSPASAFAGLRSRPGATSNEGNSDTAASPGSSLDDDSDLDESGSRWQYTGLRSVRQAQLLRGQMSNKRVASQKAIKALQNVEIESLPENERTCVICYNDFGVASPEGINEHPLRLPKCKHVFGNHCILKWFEDADSCPYCRDKLHSEPAPPSRDMLRRTYQVARFDADLGMPAYRRAIQALRRDPSGVDMYHQYAMHPRGSQPHVEGFHRDVSAAGERRAPPEDPSDTQRRQRPRHDSSRAHDQRHGSLLLTGAVTEQRYDPSNTASQQHSPVRQPFSPSQLHNPPQHNHSPDFWSRRAQNMPNLQQTTYPRASIMHHAVTNHPATLAPLGQNFSGYAPASPPVNGSASGYPPQVPHMGNYQNYSAPLGGGSLQAPASAELPLPTSFPGPPPTHSAFSQQLPHMSQFRNPAYTQYNQSLEYGRADQNVVISSNGFYAPN
ncbi:hypothetical protein N8I77_003272 [Diaporthe amygdali]|uniref:RING-type domain-containing protein n=1 Tax=Phomopsis amygdali TaxID=1214568 RepID=A0AAD9W6K5_PHOAM|nr:hypothetical protein N8I77_003272 [Diaporthe amygdali]